MKRIALLGCGAMGTRIARAIDSGKLDATLTYVYDKSDEAARTLLSKIQCAPEQVANAHLLSSQNVDIVIEAASQQAVRDVALSIIQNRKDLMIMSTGALLDESVFEVLAEACSEFKKTIYLPSGAIAGIDCIRAARDGLESVILTTTKHPDSLRGAPFFESSKLKPESIKSRTVIFEGTAQSAVSQFPANINVAAILSIAGIGGGRTRVRIVADPETTKNSHHLSAKGAFGELDVKVSNIPDEANPKTSRLAAESAIAALQAYCTGGIRPGA